MRRNRKRNLRVHQAQRDELFLDPESNLWIQVIKTAVWDYGVGVPDMNRAGRQEMKRRILDSIKHDKIERCAKYKRSFLLRKRRELKALEEFLFNDEAKPFNLQWICNHVYPEEENMADFIRIRIRRMFPAPAEWWFKA